MGASNWRRATQSQVKPLDILYVQLLSTVVEFYDLFFSTQIHLIITLNKELSNVFDNCHKLQHSCKG